MMKKALIPLALLLLAGCASKSPQQMNGRELARCAWKGNADCKTELQHRLQARQETAPATTTTPQ
ncbi:hypothetical protein QDW80_003833 [Salmonella enterica]|nr:hypothetical protein [Salmonella enterica]